MKTDQKLNTKYYFPTEGNAVCMVRMEAKSGQKIGSHKHKYEHYSVLLTGVAIAGVGPETACYHAGDVLVIPAGVEHVIEAITDITWLCVHGTDDADVDNLFEGN